MTLTPDPIGLQMERHLTITEPPESGVWDRLVPGAILEGSFGLKVEVIRVDREARDIVVREL